MTPERYQRVKSIFQEALELPSGERLAFVGDACSDDSAVRGRVETMLEAHSQESDFLERPIVPRAKSLLVKAVQAATDHDADRVVPPLPDLHGGFEKYELGGELGRGGMGRVVCARDRDLERDVALKTVRLDRLDLAPRFVDEARVMALLQHPNILPVYEVGLTGDGEPYYTMQIVHGRALNDVIHKLRDGDVEDLREYSLARRMQILIGIGQAVGYAHSKGVVHRDLKPSNVLLGGHGEVQVMDWGLSALLADRVATGAADRITGTPAYMSPEQASGSSFDERADVWALGVLLYELLVFTRPFSGDTNALLAAIATEQPRSPRAVAADRDVPIELEGLCLRALSKTAADRPTAAAFVAELQTWLEAAADRSRRHELAEAKANDGRQKLASYLGDASEVRQLEASVEGERRRFAGHESLAEKSSLHQLEDRLDAARVGMVQHAAAVVSTLEQAIGFEADNFSARRLLADYHWQRFRAADEAHDDGDRAFHARLVAGYDDGRYARELEGDGTLTLVTDPPGAQVTLHRLIETELQLRPGDGRPLGSTPLGPIELPMGSYLAILRSEGHREVRYPVYISRNRDWTGQLRLRADEDAIDTEFVSVPGGPFQRGGGDEGRGWALPRTEPEIGDFLIARQPVTMAEYLSFLDHLIESVGLDAARSRAPRPAREAPTYLVEEGGRLRLPEVDEDGDRWDQRFPVIGVSLDDAVAYCGWRGDRDGRSYRLPSEDEWEKAARGVDGRNFPWGDRFDATLCNMKDSHADRARLVTIDAFPTDLSIYGVRGMAGNTRDWTSTRVVESTGAGERVSHVARGGAWNLPEHIARCSFRSVTLATLAYALFGFRLAISPD